MGNNRKRSARGPKTIVSGNSLIVTAAPQLIIIERTRTIEVMREASPWGIDVSHHQKVIDWKKVKAAGVSFAFLKATEGGTFVDSMYRTNRAGCNANGIAVGAYHFFRPKTNVQAQVDNFCRTVGKLEAGDLPPVIDVEDPRLWTGISAKAAVDMTIEFIEGIQAKLGSGIKPIVYLSPSFADSVFKNDARLKDYPLWIANYTTGPAPRVPKPWLFWTYWQFTETGSVDGIGGNVDINRFNGQADRLNAMRLDKTMLRRPARRRRNRSRR